MSGTARVEGETADRRKRIVVVLETMETPVTVDQLVDELEASQRSPASDRGRNWSWEDVHEYLHDEDLPALDRAGLLVFDAERGLVTRHGERESRYLVEGGPTERGSTDREPTAASRSGGTTDRDDDRNDWAAYYLGAVVLSALLLAGIVTSQGPLSGLSPAAASVWTICLFGLLALLDVVRN